MLRLFGYGGALLAMSLTFTGCAGRLDPRFLACLFSGGDPDACFAVLNPPDVPTEVRATPLSSEQSIRVRWEPADGADSYVVARGDLAGGPYVDVGEPDDLTTPSYDDTTVERDRTYYYVVYAVNEVGRTKSAEVSACWCLEPPPAPANVRAESSLRGIEVSWDAAPGGVMYRVERADAAGGPYTVLDEFGGTAIDDQSVEPFRDYFYVVTAINAAGDSPRSAEVSAAWRPELPARPTGLRAVSGERGIELDWDDVPGAELYTIARAGAAGGPYTEVAGRNFSGYDDDNVEIGRTYFYVVYADNPAGRSGASDEVSGVWNPVPPAPPTDVRAAGFAGGIRVTWTAVPLLFPHYLVARAEVSGGPYAVIANLIGATAYEDTQVEQQTRYFYVVYSEDLVGVRSDASNEASAVWCGTICAFATRRAAPAGDLRFGATFSTTAGGPGSLGLGGGRLRAAGATASGTFELTVDGRTTRGTWSSATEFALDLATRTGVEGGLLVGTLESGGRLCLRVRNEYGLPGDTPEVRGSFTLVGADGDAPSVLASATYTGRIEGDGTLVLDGSGRSARSAPLPLGCTSELRAALATLREQLAALEPDLAGREAGQLSRVLAHVDAALDPAHWDGGRATSLDVLAALRKATQAARANAALRRASTEQQRGLVEVGRIAAEARLGDALVEGGASEATLAKARGHLDAAASHPGGPPALDDAIRAWTVLATG